MEEIDEVGEVDFGFDLASWMDDDGEEEEEDPISDDLGNKPDASNSKPSPEVPKIKKPRAPMTPTMRKVLSVAGGVQMPAQPIGKAAASRVKTSTPKPSKVSNTSPSPAAKKAGAQANVMVVKSEMAKPNVSQSTEQNKPVTPQKAQTQGQTKPSTLRGAKQTQALQKGKTLKQTHSAPASQESPKPPNSSNAAKEVVKTQPPTRAMTRGSNATGGNPAVVPQSKSNAVSKVSSASSKAPNQEAKASAPPTTPSVCKQIPTTSAPSKTTAQPRTSKTVTKTVHSPQNKIAQVTKAPPVAKSVALKEQGVDSKPLSPANQAASKAMNSTSSSAAKSPVPTTVGARSMATSAKQVPIAKVQSVASSPKQTKPGIKSNVPSQVDVLVTTDSTKVTQASSGKSVVKPAAPAIKTTSTPAMADECSKVAAVAIQSTSSSTPAAKAPSVSTTEGKTTTSTVSVSNSSLIHTPPSRAAGIAPLSTSAVGNAGPPVLQTSSSGLKENSANSMLSTAPASKSITQTTPASKSITQTTPASKSITQTTPASKSITQTTPASKSITQTTPASKSITQTTPASKSITQTTPASKSITQTAKTTLSATSSLKSASPKSTTDLTASISPRPSTGKSNPSIDKPKSSQGTPLKSIGTKKEEDRASSPSIAEVMALDARKDDLDDMDLGFTLSMEDTDLDFTDRTKTDSKKVISPKKRPASHDNSAAPPVKVKPGAILPKGASPLKMKDIAGDSKHVASPTPPNIKTGVSTTNNKQGDKVKPDVVPKISAPPTTTNPKVLTKPAGKRIVRRFHRASQTLTQQRSSKLLQCLIRIPALDAPQKPKSTMSVAADLGSEDERPFYVSTLPPTVKQEVLDSLLLFKINEADTRLIKPEVPFTHGISIGHVTQADIDKSLFRENIVSKASFYNFQFNGQDGVIDLYFQNEEAFQTVMIQIRKTKIGPRHLPVTFFKTLTKEEQDPDCPRPYARATVLFDQNFASSAFIGYLKAQAWNKPKVEETFSVHNMPAGIPVDFLRQLIPDAITIDVEDESLKFTQDGRRVFLGINRKSGDHVLKLFSQVYVNQHCLTLTRGRTSAADTPDLAEILKKQNAAKEENAPLKSLKTHPRDINSGSNQESNGEKPEACAGEEILMVVDDVPDAERILVGRASAWKGPSTIAHLRQAQSNFKAAFTAKTDSNNGSQLENARQDLSDISDGSDIGEDPANQGRDLSAPVLGKPRSGASVRSEDRYSRSTKGNSKDGGSKSRPTKRVDVFGRNMEMRDRFKADKQEEGTASAGRIERRRPSENDLRHFITSHRDPAESGNLYGPGWGTGRTSDGPSRGVHNPWGDRGNKPGNRSETRSPPVDSERMHGLGKYARYSPETEWMLLKRDAEKGQASGRVSRSPSPCVDSRDRFKRLVEEKLRGLEDFVRGSSRQDRDQDERSSHSSRRHLSREQDRGSDRDYARDKASLKRKLRDTSPQNRKLARNRSDSPEPRTRGITRKELMTGPECEATGHSKLSPPPFVSGRRVTIVRQRSVSPLRKKRPGRGRSSLSPIRIDDDDDVVDDNIVREREKRRRRLPEFRAKLLQSGTSTMSHGKIESFGETIRKGAFSTTEHKGEAPPQGPSSIQMPVPTSDGYGSDPEDSTSRQREILHEFVKQLLESANISSTEMETSSAAKTSHTSSSSNQPYDPIQHQHHQQDYHPNRASLYSSRDFPETQPVGGARAAQSTGQAEVSKPPNIPPPIPPPVLPPIFTPETKSEKFSQLESLANQLA
ncbi:hypothetical protein EGW08_017481, partial [Elysia chlorotica]